MRKVSKRIWSWVLAGALSLGLAGGAGIANADTMADSKEASESLVYQATLGIQTAGNSKPEDKTTNPYQWVHRLGYFGKVGRKNDTEFGTDNYRKLITGAGDKAVAHDGTFTDAEITENGTYTVLLDGADFSGDQVVSQMHIASNIPLNSNVQFSDIHLKVNDQEVMAMEEGISESDSAYLEHGKVYLLVNHWREDITKFNEECGLPTSPDNENGYVLLNGDGNDKIEVSFTVSGFDKDVEEGFTTPVEPVETETPVTSEPPAASGEPLTSEPPVVAGQKLSTPFTVELRQNESVIFSYAKDFTADGMTVASPSAVSVTGEYSISAEAKDDISSFDDVDGAIWIYTSLTEIPKDFTIKGKNLTVKHADGTENVYDWSKAQPYHNALKTTDDVRLGVINHYIPLSASKAEEYGYANPFEDNVNGTWTLREPFEIVNGDIVTFNFTVTTKAAASSPVPTATVKPTQSLNVGPAAGSKQKAGKLVYTVTKAAKANKKGTLTVRSLTASGKKAASISVPATVKIGSYQYNVTKLGKKALKGAKCKSVVLNKNIKVIPAGAFANCTKLKSLTLKAKLSSVKKGAFKGCKKSIKVKGKSKKANLAKLKKSGYKKFK